MILGEKQKLFPKLLIKLFDHIYSLGYECSLGEAWRTPEQAAWNAQHGKGIKNSLHIDRLAIDLNLFKVGKYLTDSKDYEWLGVFWESFSTPEYQCHWGGRFGDGNHFSIGHEGRK